MDPLELLPTDLGHRLALGAGRAASRTLASVPALRSMIGARPSPRAATEVLGIPMVSRLGTAAGLDKGGELLHLLAAWGFGSVEVGSVTARSWVGNRPPRLARLPEEGALWNRLGLPGPGAQRVAERLAQRPQGLAVGVNVAVTPGTPEAGRAADLLETLRLVSPHADWLTMNVSCPNLGGNVLERLSGELATVAQALRALQAMRPEGSPPAMVKLPPDLPSETLEGLVERIRDFGAVGIVAVNTRPRDLPGKGTGGESGRPLFHTARATVARLRELWPEAVLVGVGGVRTPDDAVAMRAAGADLVQVYTALVYDGLGAGVLLGDALADPEPGPELLTH